MFVDKVLVNVKAGDGGNGVVSFRQEKFIDKGGPDGGDGGKGGDIVFVGDRNQNTLVKFRYKHDIEAASGKNGSERKKRGRSADDTLVQVPLGTQVYEDGELIADITSDGQKVIIARGGDGGFGNAHFKSSTRQIPRVAELGEKGEFKELTLELKLLADAGLIGFPNAGKSTLLSVISNARPEIGDYPFTTITPNLGVVDVDDRTILIADIPGLIKGASEGKGLGGAFLRHVERTRVLVHLIDIYEEDVSAAYSTIMNELREYSAELAKRPQIVALTKIEGLPEDAIKQKVDDLKKVVGKGIEVMAISAQAHIKVRELLQKVSALISAYRTKTDEEVEEAGIPVISLSEQQEAQAWKIEKREDDYLITGRKIEKFAARTDFNTEPGIRRLKDIMRKMGIMHALERQGARAESTITIGKREGKSFNL